jgi:ribonuclease HI
MNWRKRPPSSRFPERSGGLVSKQAAILAALAQGLDLPQVLERFGLAPEELQELFREAAALYEERQGGFWRLHCDGASRGNPGPAGAGVVLHDPQGHLQVNRGRYLGETTNNVAEYQALLLGLAEARRLGVKKLQVLADSELMVRQLNGRYRVKSPHLIPLWRQALESLQQFDAYTVAHVPREENRLADAAANRAIDQKTRTG